MVCTRTFCNDFISERMDQRKLISLGGIFAFSPAKIMTKLYENFKLIRSGAYKIRIKSKNVLIVILA